MNEELYTFCPFRYYDEHQGWRCKLATQSCPEGNSLGFLHSECGTYKEEVEKL